MTMIGLNERLGEMLVKASLLTPEQLEKALEVQRGTSKRLGDVVVELGLVTELDVVATLSKQLGIPYATTASGFLTPAKDQSLEELIPEEMARQRMILPLSRNMNSLTIACLDPMDLIMIDNLRRLTGCEINPIITTRADLEQAIDVFYDKGGMLKAAVDRSYEMAEEEDTATAAGEEEGLSLDRLKQAAEEAPVIRLVDLVIRQAIKDRASDIHIEPFKDKITLRYRIDGVLYEIAPPAKSLHSAIISRIKILSKLDIAEKRLPQDGAFFMMMDNQAIDFRVSSIPTIYGEKVVIRILKKTPELLDLGQIGLEARELERCRKAIQDPYGLIFVTGPTGSGKTTTLYAALNEIRSSKRNIVTIEDPVEYRLEGINQVQIKPSIGLTFASGLRAFLRQDPDVMMVGEVRDQETAEICIQASLTGHLVFSTLHTNDAPSSITRLTDMGVPPYLLSSTISIVIAQRLLRRLCQQCREAYEPLPAIAEKFQITEGLLYKAKGCDQCAQTGYRGRIGVHEAMLLNRELCDLIAKGEPTHLLKAAAVKSGMATLWDNGLKKVRAGLTSLEELESVVLLDKI